jgi:hypothetical protein
MVWSTATAQRPVQPTTILVLPPLNVPIIAEQWDDQLPGGAAVIEKDLLAVDENENQEEQEEITLDGENGDKKPSNEVNGDQSTFAEIKITVEDTSSNTSRTPTSTKRKRNADDQCTRSGPLPVPPTSPSHPYHLRPVPTLTPSHLRPDVIARARELAAEHGIQLAISDEDAAKIDVSAYTNALVDPATVGSGLVAAARAARSRARVNDSMDVGAFGDDGGMSASPGPMSGIAGGGTPGPSTPGTPSASVSGRGGSGRGRGRGMGRWGHLYAKRAQQAAAAAIAAKQAEEAQAAAAALASAHSYLQAQAGGTETTDVAKTETTERSAEEREREEREERERAEEGLALMRAMEEKKKEQLAKGLGSASWW